MTGGMTLAGTPDRWEWLQSAYRTFQSIGIDDCRLITPQEAKELCPIMSSDGILGGMWADREGYVDTTGTVHAYAGAARKYGATVIENNRVLDLNQTANGWEVVTEQGTKARLDAVTACFARYGYAPEKADARARILYFMQLGYHALEVRETIETRMSRVEAYMRGFTGQQPDPEAIAGFHEKVRALGLDDSVDEIPDPSDIP